LAQERIVSDVNFTHKKLLGCKFTKKYVHLVNNGKGEYNTCIHDAWNGC